MSIIKIKKKKKIPFTLCRRHGKKLTKSARTGRRLRWWGIGKSVRHGDNFLGIKLSVFEFSRWILVLCLWRIGGQWSYLLYIRPTDRTKQQGGRRFAVVSEQCYYLRGAHTHERFRMQHSRGITLVLRALRLRVRGNKFERRRACYVTTFFFFKIVRIL